MPESPPVETSSRKNPPEWVNALVSVYYRTSTPEREMLPPEALLLSDLNPLFGRATWLMPLREALDLLYGQMKGTEGGADNDSALLNRLLVRVALAQLVRAGRPTNDLSLLPQRDWMELAVGALLESSGNWAALSTRDTVLPELFGYSTDGDARFAHAFAYRSWLGTGRYDIRDIWTSRSFRHRVVDASTSVLVKRPVDDFRSAVTPLVWNRIKWLWSAAYYTDAIPSDLATKPASVNPVVGQSSLFYEEAYLGWNATPVARYRNVLNVREESSETKVRFDFSEAACLTTEFAFGPKYPGGIDVDRGHAQATHVDRDNEVWCRFEGRKRFRGNLPRDETFAAFYAQLTSITVPLLIEASVLIGSQLI